MVEDVPEVTGTYFPVVLYDGEREIKMGNMKIVPSMNFKSFQFDLSQKIGISPNQITVYLVDRKRPKSFSEPHRKMPITSKSNFAAIAKETDCDFLAVLKRARRNRKTKPRLNKPALQFGDYFPGSELGSPVSPLPGKLFLLRRDQPDMINPLIPGYPSSYYDRIGQMELEQRLQNLQIQRNNYAMMMNTNPFPAPTPTPALNLDSFPRIEESYRNPAPFPNRPFCEECYRNVKNRGCPPEFHLCVNDPIIENRRRVWAGPITPPTKAGH